MNKTIKNTCAFLLSIAVIGASTIGFGVAANAATTYSPQNTTDLMTDVAQAQAGDTINLAAGITYNIDTSLVFNASVTLNGNGATINTNTGFNATNITTGSGYSSYPMILCNNTVGTVTISNLTINSTIPFLSSTGASIVDGIESLAGNTILTNVTIANMYSSDTTYGSSQYSQGIGVILDGTGDATISGCSISNCQKAAIYDTSSGTTNISNTVINGLANNSISATGIDIRAGKANIDTTTFSNLVFTDPAATGITDPSLALLSYHGASATLTNSTFTNVDTAISAGYNSPGYGGNIVARNNTINNASVGVVAYDTGVAVLSNNTFHNVAVAQSANPQNGGNGGTIYYNNSVVTGTTPALPAPTDIGTNAQNATPTFALLQTVQAQIGDPAQVDTVTVTDPGAKQTPNPFILGTMQWGTSDPSVATVDSSGKISFVGVGTATIVALTHYQVKALGATQFPLLQKTVVTVTAVPVTSVSLNKTTLNMNTGDTTTLVANIVPTAATNQGVIWASSDTSVATVDANGNVTAVGSGTATITVTTADGNFKSTCLVTVASASSSSNASSSSSASSASSSSSASGSSSFASSANTSSTVSGTTIPAASTNHTSPKTGDMSASVIFVTAGLVTACGVLMILATRKFKTK